VLFSNIPGVTLIISTTLNIILKMKFFLAATLIATASAFSINKADIAKVRHVVDYLQSKGSVESGGIDEHGRIGS
jgi:hypothetical protein